MYAIDRVAKIARGNATALLLLLSRRNLEKFRKIGSGTCYRRFG
jgi:hypothetical protein